MWSLNDMAVWWTAAVLLAGVPAVGQEDEDAFAACEASFAADPESWESAKCFFTVARDGSQWDEARRRLEAHLDRRQGNPHLTFNLARIEFDNGQVQQAEELFRRAAERFAGRSEFYGVTWARLNRSKCLRQLGRLEEAGLELQEAEEAARYADEEELLIQVYIAQARQLLRTGQRLEEALRILRQIEIDLEAERVEVTDPDALFRIRKNLFIELGNVLFALGRYRQAFETERRWAQTARDAGRVDVEAAARANMAVTFCKRRLHPGARAEATALARDALEVAERSGDRAAEAQSLDLLGRLIGGQEGRAYLQRCLEVAEANGRSLHANACRFALAGNLVLDRPAEARVVLDEALTLALATDDPWTAAESWAERFDVLWATLPREQAVAESLAVLDHIEALRRLQDSEAGRAGFFAAWTRVHYSLAGRLLAAEGGPSRKDLETAFAVAERMRARVLLDSLLAADAEPLAGTWDNDSTRSLRRIVALQRRLQDPGLTHGERTSVLEELDQAYLALAEDATRGGKSRLPQAGFATLSELESSLAPDEALLTFQLAPWEDVFGRFAGGSWLLAVTRGGTRAYALPGRWELTDKVGFLLGGVGGRDDGELAEMASVLYETLLGTALEELPAVIKKLAIVPDDELHKLPFGLLHPHPQLATLAERFQISLVPSATLRRHWQQQEPPMATATVLALADPAFLSANGAGVEGERQWALSIGARLGRLPHAREEGRAVVRQLGGAPSRLLVGEQATEAFVKSASVSSFQVLHLAAHALVDERRPERSAVLLAPGGPQEDGLLQPREIAALELTGQLVVLAACRSGSGQVLSGEGVQSLARAFFRAGARAVLASLWRLQDDEAAAFFETFYSYLAAGESVSEAVASARQARREAGAPAAAWAGVVVLGDGDAVPVHGGVEEAPGPLTIAAAGILVVVLLAVLLRRRALLNPSPGFIWGLRLTGGNSRPRGGWRPGAPRPDGR